MGGNFNFLKDNDIFKSFYNTCIKVEKSISISSATCVILTRRALELSVKWLYSFDEFLSIPYQDNLSSLIHDNNFRDDELAKRLDLVMYTIELANLQDLKANKPIRFVIKTAEQFSKLGTIPQIQEKKYLIEEIKTEEFWNNVNIFELEEVRNALRDLLKYLDRNNQKPYYTNFNDFIISETSNVSMHDINDIKNYRKKVEHYLNSHKDDLVIFKLRNNKKLTKQDIETLESIMWNKLGTNNEYKKEFGNMPVGKLVRKLVGLDRHATNEAFSEFLNNKN